jgi:hypothetical protein
MFGLVQLVLNPGTMTDSRIMAHGNRTIVSEERHHTYVNRQLAESFTDLSNRDELVCLMHSIPTDMPIDQLRPLVHELRACVGTLYLTDLSESYYHSFSPRFAEFVDLITET